MNKKISLGMAISLMAIVATIAIALTYSLAINVFESRMSAFADRQTTDDLTVEIDNKVRQKYYADISEENIRVGIANGIVDGLGDPNCAYFTAEQWELERDRAVLPRGRCKSVPIEMRPGNAKEQPVILLFPAVHA